MRRRSREDTFGDRRARKTNEFVVLAPEGQIPRMPTVLFGPVTGAKSTPPTLIPRE